MASKKIRIRTYQIGFGDCFLVSVPDDNKYRHMLIDFGNAIGKGGKNVYFPIIAKNIRKETNGHIDVVVLTHEHADHTEGFLNQKKIFKEITVDTVWMSLPSDPNYYKNYPKAKRHKRVQSLAGYYSAFLAARRMIIAPSFMQLVQNNITNKQRVDYIRKLTVKKNVKYLARGKPRTIIFLYLPPVSP